MLSVLQDDQLIAASRDMWLARLELDGTPSTDRVRHVVDDVQIVNRTAHVRMRVFINERHVYTDLLGPYKFPAGWQIANKVFAAHD